MGIGDLLSFIGIILAIVAFLSEKERDIILLKFRKWESIIMIAIIFFNIYLILFDDYFYKWDFYINCLIWNNAFAANVDAFFLSFLLVVYILWKIVWAKFPKSNYDKLLNLYNELCLRGEEIAVLEFIKKNHNVDLINYLSNRSREYKPWLIKNKYLTEDDEFSTVLEFYKVETHTKYPKLINTLLAHLINKDLFINKSTDYSPDFLWKLLLNMKFPSTYGSEIYKKFVRRLLLERNPIIRNRFKGLKIHLNEDYFNEEFWDLFKSVEFIKYHSITRMLSVLGERELLKDDNIRLLSIEFKQQIHSEQLEGEFIVDVIYLNLLIGTTIIENKLEARWINNIEFVSNLQSFATTILRNLELEKQPNEWYSFYLNFGLKIIDLITNVLLYFIVHPTIKSGNTDYVKYIINSYIRILVACTFYNIPENVKQEYYDSFFKIFSSENKNDKTTAIEIQRIFKSILVEELPRVDEGKFRKEIKLRWVGFTKDKFSKDDFLEFEKILQVI